jgi:RNA polymerase sigma factor (sigma-70 family)
MSALLRGRGSSSFDRLYRRHVATVYRYVYAVPGNHADAEDVTQQTFLNAFRSMAEGTKPRKAENWLVTIAHNEVRRHFRRTRGRPLEVELDDRLPHPPKEVEDPSLADVLRALQHLPPEQRAALVMREFEGRPYKEIAQILGVTQDALEGLIFRARRGLAEQLEGALTCAEAEDALLRRLDTRLRRRETRRLKDHLRECQACVRFATVQKRQRSLLKGLSILPIPASLYAFRGEQAALAAGLGGGGGAAATTGVVGLAAKAAAVTASAAVVGGVGYGVTTGPATAAKAEPTVSHVAAVKQTRGARRAADVPRTKRPRLAARTKRRAKQPPKATTQTISLRRVQPPTHAAERQAKGHRPERVGAPKEHPATPKPKPVKPKKPKPVPPGQARKTDDSVNPKAKPPHPRPDHAERKAIREEAKAAAQTERGREPKEPELK